MPSPLLSSCCIAISLFYFLRCSEVFSAISSQYDRSGSQQHGKSRGQSTISTIPLRATGMGGFSSLTDTAGSNTIVNNDSNNKIIDGFDFAATELTSFSKGSNTPYSQSAGASPTPSSASEESTSKYIKSPGIESEFPKRKIKANVRETGTDSMKYYIKSMCNHELLNKNEEIILAREIQILLKWEEEREKLEEKLLR